MRKHTHFHRALILAITKQEMMKSISPKSNQVFTSKGEAGAGALRQQVSKLISWVAIALVGAVLMAVTAGPVQAIADAGQNVFVERSGYRKVDIAASTNNKYQTKADGNWSDVHIWQVSINGSQWSDAVSAPNAASSVSIFIKNNIKIDTNITIDQTVISSGSTLTLNHGVALTIADGFGADLAGDTIIIKGSGTITNQGQILAHSITITTDNGTVTNNGTIDASSSSSGNNGGTVRVEASDEIKHTGLIDVSSSNGTGGQVYLLAHHIGLLDSAVIKADGYNGGGIVRVGGGWQGGEGLDRASAVVMASTATISANVIHSGDGGSVVLWSNDYTGFYGNISAKGGTISGNGGMVETSSHDNLQAFGNVNAGSTHGNAGQWLLDPRNVEIVAGSGLANFTVTSGGGANTFKPTANNSQLGVDYLTGGVQGLVAANVIISTDDITGGAQPGNITVSVPITWNSTHYLKLNADGAIAINAAITNNSSGGLTLNAANSSSPFTGGAITITAPIITTGGYFIVNNYGTFSNSGSGTITTNGGYVKIDRLNTATPPTQGVSVTVGANITTGGGYFQCGSSTAVGTASFINNAAINTSGGAVTISADNMALGGGTINSGAGLVTLQPMTTSRAIDIGTETSGKLSLTATELKTITSSGGVTVTHGSGTLTVSAATNLTQSPNILTGGTLTYSAGSGNISMEAALTSPIDVTCTSIGSITFGSSGSITATGHNVSLSGSSIASTTGSTIVTASGLTTNSSGGIGASAHLKTVVSSLTVNESSNAQTINIDNTGDVSVTVGLSSVTTDCTLSKTSATSLTVAGGATSAITTTSGSINNVSMSSTNCNWILGALTISGNLSISASNGNTITQSGALTMTGTNPTLSLTTDVMDNPGLVNCGINLNNAFNSLGSATLILNGNGNITIINNDTPGNTKLGIASDSCKVGKLLITAKNPLLVANGARIKVYNGNDPDPVLVPSRLVFTYTGTGSAIGVTTDFGTPANPGLFTFTYNGTPAGSFTISGSTWFADAGHSFTLLLDGGSSTTVATDAGGNYSFTGLTNTGNYLVYYNPGSGTDYSGYAANISAAVNTTLNLALDVLKANTSMETMRSALGPVTGTYLPYTVSGYNITVKSGIDYASVGAFALDGSLTTASGNIDFSDGALTLGAASTIGSTAAGKTLAASAINNIGLLLTVTGAGNGAISGVISGAGGLTKSGTGTLTLSNTANTFSGAVTITQGTLSVAALADAGTNSSLGTGSGTSGISLGSATAATLKYTGSGNSSNRTINLTGAGTIDASGGGTLTLAGGVTGAAQNLTLTGTGAGTESGVIATTTGALTKTGTGTWTLSGANTYTGLTTISAGTLKLGTAGNGFNTPLGTIAAGTVVSATGAALDLNGVTLSTDEALTLNGTGIYTGGALINSSATGVSYSGLITLGSPSSIVGGTGTINISNPGTITGAGFGLTLGGAAGGTLGSILGTGAGTLTKADAGTWTLSGANTYTGLTTISAGTLQLGNIGALNSSSGTVSVTSGAVLDLNGTTLTTAPALTVNGTGISSGGAVRNSSVTAASLSGAVTLGSASSVGGSGDLTLSGAVNASGNTLTIAMGGTKDFKATNASNNFGTVEITSGNNVSLTDANSIALGNSTVSGTLSVTANADLTSTGDIAVNGAQTATANKVFLNTGGSDTGTARGYVVNNGAITHSGASAKLFIYSKNDPGNTLGTITGFGTIPSPVLGTLNYADALTSAGATTPYAYYYSTAPTTQASSIIFSSVQASQMTIGWTNGNGAKRAVFVKEGTGAITNPSDNTTYTASTNWASKGTQLGASGYYCV